MWRRQRLLIFLRWKGCGNHRLGLINVWGGRGMDTDNADECFLGSVEEVNGGMSVKKVWT